VKIGLGLLDGFHRREQHRVFEKLAVSDRLADPRRVLIDNPAGGFRNYTYVYINDSFDATQSYAIKWSAEPAAPPSGYASFNQKYITFTTSGTVNISEFRWNWYDSELSVYNENLLEVQAYGGGGGWSNVSGQTRDTADNYISVTDFVPTSSATYGLLYNGTPYTCQQITASGSYSLSANAVGAPFDAAPFTSSSACIKISAPNVLFDCNGYNITNYANKHNCKSLTRQWNWTKW